VPVYHLHPCALAAPCPAPASPAPALSNLSLSYARVPRCWSVLPHPAPASPALALPTTAKMAAAKEDDGKVVASVLFVR
jgi:hypothetical protein